MVVAGRLVLAGECRVRVCFVVCVRVSCPVSCVVRASGRFFCFVPSTGAMALAVSPILLAVPRAQGQARRMRMAEVPHSVLVSSALSTHNPGI